jgi:thiamine biosynthesis lipoprotein
VTANVDRPSQCRRARPLLGTLVDVEACGGADARHAVAAAFEAIAEVHRLMNRHDPGSDIGRINAAPANVAVRVDSRTRHVLEIAAALHRDSDGAFDCTRHAEDDGRGHWELCGDIVRKSGPCTLDLGGIAKGYAVDCAIDVMRRFELDQALVNAGGDMRHIGVVARDIAVRDPAVPAEIALHCRLLNEALASSSAAGLSTTPPGQSRIVGHLNEIPLRAGASVLAPTCMLADALTKVVLATGAPAHPLLARYGARTLLYRDGLPDGRHPAG